MTNDRLGEITYTLNTDNIMVLLEIWYGNALKTLKDYYPEYIQISSQAIKKTKQTTTTKSLR